MKDILKFAGIGLVVVILGVLIASKFDNSSVGLLGGAGCNGGNCTDFDAVNTSAGYYVDDIQVVDGSGNFIGAINAGTTTVGNFTQGGGVLNIATTSATYVLTSAELASNSQIKIVSMANSPALTLTLPATSTMATLIPTAGQMKQWYIWNAHTAAATTTTVTAGTGIDLQGDGTGSDVLNGGVFGFLACTRLGTTDVMCEVQEFVAAD